MSAVPNPSIDRRRLLRTGGLALSFGAITAACGTNRGGSDDPGRIGLAPVPTELPAVEVDDLVLLRTAQSVEHVLIDLYVAVTELDVVDAATTALFDRYTEDHTDHAAALGELIVERDGEEYPCANPWIWNRMARPVLAAIEDSDDQVRDVLNSTQAFEVLAGTTYQDFTGLFTEPELRRDGMLIGAHEDRHAAVLAIDITGAPDAYFSPAVFGEEALPDEEGFVVPYAIPSAFGQLTPIELVVGDRSAEGTRTVVTLTTPAQNSFVYPDMSC